MSCASFSSFTSCIQNFYYVGINFQGILYGIEIVLYLKTLHLLLRRRPLQRNELFYLVFSTVMFFLVTMTVARSALEGPKAPSANQDPNSASPDAYKEMNYFFFGSGAIIIIQQMTDGLMIYRSYVLWDSYCAIIIPCILWLIILVLGILICWATQIPGNHLIFGVGSQFWLAYYALSVVLNLTTTCLICSRLVIYARTIRKHLGAKHASPYFNIILLVVESALPLTLCGIALAVSSGIRSPVAVVFSRMYILMMSISPQVLILRAAEGKAWSIESLNPPNESAITFAPGPSLDPDSDDVPMECYPPDSPRPGSISHGQSELDAFGGNVGVRMTKIVSNGV